MSNTILNLRFGAYHLQIVRFSDWRGEIMMNRSPITFGRNPYQAANAMTRHKLLSRKAWGTWFEVM